MRLLDLFCGRWGWSRAFAARGWVCVGVDLVEPPEIPQGCTFIKCDVLQMSAAKGRVGVNAQIFGWLQSWDFDFLVASSPCEEFSVHGMKHFHPNPPYPEIGIKLFNHTRSLFEGSGLPYIMENVRSAQQFVGNAVHHCGPFYLWGKGVPLLMPQGIVKGMSAFQGDLSKAERKLPLAIKTKLRKERGKGLYEQASKLRASQTATIPPELANCVADYAERICEVTA